MTDSPFRGRLFPLARYSAGPRRQLDLEGARCSINCMIDAGVDGSVLPGTSGAGCLPSIDAQRYHVLQEAIAMVHGRVPVLTGIIDMETMRVVDQASARRATA